MDPSHHSNEVNQIPTNDNTITDPENEVNQIPTNDNTITDPDNHDEDETIRSELFSILDMLATFSDAMEEEDGLQGVDNGGDGLDFDVGDIRGYIEEVMRNEQEIMRPAMVMNNQNGYDPNAGPIAGTPVTMMMNNQNGYDPNAGPVAGTPTTMMMNNQNGYEPNAGPVAGTPASESSIEALEKVTVVEKEEEGSKMGKFECSICFEGSSNDPEASRMPCSHLFHTKCIISWLHTRNTCPLCRFEMPTGDEK